MFVVLVIFILLKIPVAFALFLTAIVFIIPFLGSEKLYLLSNGFFNMMSNWSFTAVIPFIFMAEVMNVCGVGVDMFQALQKMLGRKSRGSYILIVAILSYLISLMSGAVASALSILALLAYPAMIETGLPQELTAGFLMASGSLPQIIPPSLNMIMYGLYTNTSIGMLFAGGMGPGTLMAVFYALYIYMYIVIKKIPISSGKNETGKVSLGERIKALKDFIGPFVIIIATLGSIYRGIATPTEAASIGAIATIIYVVLRKRLTLAGLKKSLLITLRTTSFIFFIVSAAMAFGSVFNMLGGDRMMMSIIAFFPPAYAHILTIALALIIVFLLGMFLETFSVIIIAGPLFHPIITGFGYDPVWWGVVFCSILQIGFLTPPVGMSLYIFKNLRPELSWSVIFKSVWPYVLLTVIATVIPIIFPDVITVFVKILTGR
jgi:tripartite ATP-independent transporter DctM subunit